MLNSASTRTEALPKIPVNLLLSAGTLSSFAWLLLQDRIHPAVMYLLQVYLTF